MEQKKVTVPLYSIGTWDAKLHAYTAHDGVPAFNLTRSQLVASMRLLKREGYTCHRYRTRLEDGSLSEWADDSDPAVIIERTDGQSEDAILQGWGR